MDMGGKDSYEIQIRKHKEAVEEYYEKLEAEQRTISWLPTVNRPTPKREKEKEGKMNTLSCCSPAHCHTTPKYEENEIFLGFCHAALKYERSEEGIRHAREEKRAGYYFIVFSITSFITTMCSIALLA